MADEELSIKIRNLVQGAHEVERLARDYQQLDRRTRRDFNDPTNRLRGGISKTQAAVVGLTGAFTALGGAIAIRELVRATDRYRQLEGQLNTVTRSQEETNQRFEDLHGIANETYAALDSTVNLYARVTRATEELGDATDAQVLRFTKVVNQAIAASGASMTEASAATTQLTQGLASGIFRAEEFNSVLEQTPRLAQAIADGLGVTIGQLRQMLLDGELTSERVFQAILDQTGEIEEEFNALPQRVDQALTQLGNDLTAAFGQADVDGLVEAIGEFRATVTDPQFVESVNNLAELVFDFANNIGPAIRGVDALFNNIGEGMASVYGMLPDERNVVEEADKARAQLNERLKERINLQKELDRLGSDESAARAIAKRQLEEVNGEIERLNNRLLTLGRRAQSQGGAVPDISGVDEDLSDAGGGGGGGAPADIDIDQSGAPGFRARDNRGSRFSSDAAKRAAKIYENTRTAVERYQQAIGELEQLHEMGLITQETYNRALEEQKEKLKEAGDQAEETGEEMSEFAKQAKRNIESQLGETLRRSLTGSFDDIEDAWRDMIFNMATEAAAAQLSEWLFGEGEGFGGGAIGAAFQAIGSGSGGGSTAAGTGSSSSAASGGSSSNGWLNTVVSFIGTLFHSGRVAGAGGTHAQRAVDPAAFAHAPRLHQGIRSDEIPAIIHKSEDVVTKDSPRHSSNFNEAMAAAAGGKPEVNTRIVNQIGEQDVADAMSGAPGEEVILNVIRRNPEIVRSS